MDPADFVRQKTAITAPPLVSATAIRGSGSSSPRATSATSNRWQSVRCAGSGASPAEAARSCSAIPVALISPPPAYASVRVTTCRPAENWKAPSDSPASYGASCRIWGGTAEPSENHRGRGARDVADTRLGIELLPAGGVGRPDLGGARPPDKRVFRGVLGGIVAASGRRALHRNGHRPRSEERRGGKGG